MKTELGDTKEKLEQAQNDLNAWKFTPDRFVKLNYLNQMKLLRRSAVSCKIVEYTQGTVAEQCS